MPGSMSIFFRSAAVLYLKFNDEIFDIYLKYIWSNNDVVTYYVCQAATGVDRPRQEQRGAQNAQKTGETHNGNGSGNDRNGTRVGRDTLDSTDFLHHLHGDDRQPAIRLDAVRQSDQQGAWLVDRLDSGRLRDLHRA